MEIVNSEIERYLSELSEVTDPVLKEMEEEGNRRRFPIVGPLVGRIFRQLVLISGARRILELGSGFGYSAYWFASALEEKGEIILTEFSQENLDQAQAYFVRGKLSCRRRFYQGDALQIIDLLEGPFDIIFNDVDKPSYPRAIEKAFPLLRKGGMFVSDNVLWKGKVTAEASDQETGGILTFNRVIFQHPGLFSSIIPLRDGVSISVKGR